MSMETMAAQSSQSCDHLSTISRSGRHTRTFAYTAASTDMKTLLLPKRILLRLRHDGDLPRKQGESSLRPRLIPNQNSCRFSWTRLHSASPLPRRTLGWPMASTCADVGLFPVRSASQKAWEGLSERPTTGGPSLPGSSKISESQDADVGSVAGTVNVQGARRSRGQAIEAQANWHRGASHVASAKFAPLLLSLQSA